MVSTKERLTKPLMKSQKFSIKESNSIIMIMQLLVMGSSNSVLSSRHSMTKKKGIKPMSQDGHQSNLLERGIKR